MTISRLWRMIATLRMNLIPINKEDQEKEKKESSVSIIMKGVKMKECDDLRH